MLNPRRFYGAAAGGEHSGSDSEEDISISESDGSYRPSHSSSSESSESDIDNAPDRDTSSDSDDEQSINGLRASWFPVDGTHRKQFVFSEVPGIHGLNGISASDIKPIDVYSILVNDDVYNLVVEQTNINAQQVIMNRRISRKSRLKSWKDTDEEEIKKFFSIVMYMGVVKYPSIDLYWSRDPFYKNNFVPPLMSRNRFQLLLRFMHFAENRDQTNEDRLLKLRKLLEILEENFTKSKTPGNTIAVDETMVPWRGRLVFRQYNPGKAHKYGVKIYKLCDPQGYTYTTGVYIGKNALAHRGQPTATTSHSTQIVLDLAEKYLNSGRTVTTDNFYTSLALANILLENETHLVGTLRKNRVGNPKDVTEARLDKGEIVGKENVDGVVVAKWRSKRDVLMLSTKHDLEIVATGKKNKLNEDIMKPEIIISYNKAKQGIDISDQMASYFTPLRKTLRWYHKIAFEYLLNTAVINALIIYQEIKGHNVKIAQFRHDLIYSLANVDEAETRRLAPAISTRPVRPPNVSVHRLEESMERNNRNRRKRKRCCKCYEELKKSTNREEASKKAKRVSTFCKDCDGQPAYCLECFAKHH